VKPAALTNVTTAEGPGIGQNRIACLTDRFGKADPDH
jgi:hypothetical protein